MTDSPGYTGHGAPPAAAAEALVAAVEGGRWDRAAALTEALDHDALGDALNRVSDAALARYLEAVGDDRVAVMLSRLDDVETARIVLRLSHAHGADIIEEMNPDDAADVVGELTHEAAERILTAMEPDEAKDVRHLLTYPPETAGGLMTPEFIAVREDATIEDALQHLRALTPDTATSSYIYVLDPGGRLVGVLPLYALVKSLPATKVAEVMRREVKSLSATTDQEAAARSVLDANLLALPVVDDQHRLLGIITIDDVADVLEEEATEDVERLGGAQPLEYPYLRAGVMQIVWKRWPWLLFLFVANFFTGGVVRHFDPVIQQLTQLVWFVPLVLGTGGNAATQAVTTVVRAMAVGEVEVTDTLKVLSKELAIGLIVAVLLGGVGALWGLVLTQTPRMGVAVGVGQACVLVWATGLGGLMPLAAKRLGLDPALVSGPLMATFIDAVGLVIYFSLAMWVMGM